MARRHIEFYGTSQNGFGVNLKAPEGDTTSAMFLGQKGQLFVHNIAKKFTGKAESLRADSHFTPEGRIAELAKTATECLKELRGIKKFVEPLTFKYKCFDSTNLPALRPTREPNESIRRMEIRQFLSAQDGAKRKGIFDQAVAELDDEILGAFFERADLYQLLGKAFIDQGRKQYLEKKAPDLLAAQIAGSVLTYNIKKTAEDLGSFADNPADAEAILSELPTKLDWSFESNNDFRTIEHNNLTSGLPSPSAVLRSDSQRKEALKKGKNFSI